MMGRELEAPPALMRRLDQMADAGVELAPLIRELNKMFPNSVPRLRGNELLQRAREARAGAMRLDLPDPPAEGHGLRKKPRPVARAVRVDPDQPDNQQPQTRGNGPRTMKPKGTRGVQLKLDFGNVQNAGAAQMVGTRPAMPFAPSTLLPMGAQLMLPGIIKPVR